MATVILSGALGEDISRLIKNSQPANSPSNNGDVAQLPIEVAADNVRTLIRELDKLFPGIGHKLRSGVAVAIDGEIFANPLLEKLEVDSEVAFIPAIEAG